MSLGQAVLLVASQMLKLWCKICIYGCQSADVSTGWMIFTGSNSQSADVSTGLKRHKSIGVFVVYIDTGSSMPISPSKSCDLADENNKILTEWKRFETTVLSILRITI